MAVELEARSGFHVRIGSLAVTPQRFLAVHHWPAQPALLVICVEWREVVPMATTERGVLFEETLLHVEPAALRLVVYVTGFHVGQRKLVDLTIPEQHLIERLAADFRLLRDLLGRPDFLDLEVLRELHQLPEIRACLARRVD